MRDVELEPERSTLIRDAFALYSSGDYSLMELAALMVGRGLRPRPTKRTPERALGINRLAEVLRNPYYIGQVRFRGEDRRHHYYLRGSLFCGKCCRRLVYM